VPSVGVITFELRLDESHSLKDKRHFVKSLKDRLREPLQRIGGRNRLSGSCGSARWCRPSPCPADHAHAEQVLQLRGARSRGTVRWHSRGVERGVDRITASVLMGQPLGLRPTPPSASVRMDWRGRTWGSVADEGVCPTRDTTLDRINMAHRTERVSEALAKS
jgi:hypothetical protein